jgi:hypothetical protein
VSRPHKIGDKMITFYTPILMFTLLESTYQLRDESPSANISDSDESEFRGFNIVTCLV